MIREQCHELVSDGRIQASSQGGHRDAPSHGKREDLLAIPLLVPTLLNHGRTLIAGSKDAHLPARREGGAP
jgi:hypothetical protein